ncbi:MAG: N-formylglutamate amidohydrolase, partial [Hyphomicrobiaceae bacterium]|nr:N-formylglutamate amidohydrolase [Hyphomicrobiaceae bacterium]
GGLGTIARVVSPSEEIYAERLPLRIGLERIKYLYTPFHAALNDLIEQTRRKFGFAILIDCHSMPSTSSMNPKVNRPDFIVGDRYGTSCHKHLTQIVRQSLAQIGQRVRVNQPYAGGFITEHYGHPKNDVHAVQIEINRRLYLDEPTLMKSCKFQHFKEQMSSFCLKIVTQAPNIIMSSHVTK